MAVVDINTGLPLVGEVGPEDSRKSKMVPPKENASLREAVVGFNDINAQAVECAVRALDYIAAGVELRAKVLKAKEHQDKRAEYAARAAGVDPKKAVDFDVDKALVFYED